MLKIIGRILVILLVTAAIGTAIYFVAQSAMAGSAYLEVGLDGQPPTGFSTSQGQGAGLHNGTGPGAGGRGGEEQRSLPNEILLVVLKDLSIIALATVVVALIRKVMPKKPINDSADLT